MSRLNPNGERILRVLSYLQKNYYRKITLIEIADVAAMSQAHFHRMYHAVMGETVFQTQKRIKMRHAHHLLQDDEILVKNIAKNLGFSSTEAFTRSFQSYFGHTPTMWRYLVLLPLHHKEKEQMMKQVQIIDMPAFKALTLAHKGSYHLIGNTFNAINAWLMKYKKLADIEKMMSFYYDDPSTTDEKDLRADAAILLNNMDNLPLDGGLYVKEFAAQKFAMIEHNGPYENLDKTYQWIYGEWLIKDNDRYVHADFPVMEEYINNPSDTKPENLITYIYIPIKPA